MWIYGSDMDGESMKNVILQLVMAFVGSLGFAMLFRLRRALWISASLGGVFCWGGYLLVMYFSDGQIFTSALAAAALAAVYAELLAARKRAPVPLFLIPSVVPLIPGSTLYYTMSAAVQGNTEEVSHYGSLTLQNALSIAGGSCIVWTLLSIFRRYYVLQTQVTANEVNSDK